MGMGSQVTASESRRWGPSSCNTSSTSVFQESQSAHLPDHLGCTAPHSSQMNRVFTRIMRPVFPLTCIVPEEVSRVPRTIPQRLCRSRVVLARIPRFGYHKDIPGSGQCVKPCPVNRLAGKNKRARTLWRGRWRCAKRSRLHKTMHCRSRSTRLVSDKSVP